MSGVCRLVVELLGQPRPCLLGRALKLQRGHHRMGSMETASVTESLGTKLKLKPHLDEFRVIE